jgi:hypothetical protein
MSELESPLQKLKRDKRSQFELYQLLGAELILSIEGETVEVFSDLGTYYKNAVQGFSSQSTIVLVDNNDRPIGLISRKLTDPLDRSPAVSPIDVGRLLSPFVKSEILQPFAKLCADEVGWNSGWRKIV